MPFDPDDPRPPFLQVAGHLRDAITSGRYKPGDKLPSRHQLAAEYDVAPMTAQSAVRTLRGEGLVVSRQGKGVFVRVRADASPAARLRTAHRILSEIHCPISAADQRCRECHDVLGGHRPWPCLTHRKLAPLLDEQADE